MVETKRCFLAIQLPAVQAYHEAVQNLKESTVSKISVVDPMLYHLTLHFFGNITDDRIDEIKEILDGFSFDPFNLTLGPTGVIPPKGNKLRVLYVDNIEDSPDLRALVQMVQDLLVKIKEPLPKRNFLPHLTVARVKFAKNTEEVRKHWLKQSLPRTEVLVSKISLIHSVLTPNGPIYSEILAFSSE